jgi:hypothetical protein
MNPPSINHSQSDRGGPFGFRTIGRLVKQHFTQLFTLINDLELTTSSLTVAGPFGFRTIGRLVNYLFQSTTSINHLDEPFPV